jgi:hypothetical protein
MDILEAAPEFWLPAFDKEGGVANNPLFHITIVAIRESYGEL